eukprot:GHVQ01021279.1.p1 GENE.GHVQ01021279.1~~GHVQ01021279.1.p1  ORF type:complete len:178 (-),score=25.18 GHVQ01021279.1:1255-1788(-)
MTDEANHMDKYEKIKRLRTADGCTSNYPSPCSISFYKMSLLELKYLRDCLSLRTIVANSPRLIQAYNNLLKKQTRPLVCYAPKFVLRQLVRLGLVEFGGPNGVVDTDRFDPLAGLYEQLNMGAIDMMPDLKILLYEFCYAIRAIKTLPALDRHIKEVTVAANTAAQIEAEEKTNGED